MPAVSPFIFLKNYTSYHAVQLQHIIYTNSDGLFTTIYLANSEPLIIRQPVQYFNNTLAPYHFVRIHNSVLVNVYYLKDIIRIKETYQAVLQSGLSLVIARQRKKMVLQTMLQYSIAGKTQAFNKLLEEPADWEPLLKPTLVPFIDTN